MRRFLSAASLCFGLLSLAALSGCKQGDGERCEIDSDCKSGLVCDGTVAGSASVTTELVCCQPNQCPEQSTGRDAAAPGDGGEGGADATFAPDAVDAAVEDARASAGGDAGLDAAVPGPDVDAVDAAPVDAASVDAAPSDVAPADGASAPSFG